MTGARTVLPRLALRVDEVADMLSISRSQLYVLIRRDEVPYVRIGNSIRIPREALETWLRVRTRGAPPRRPRASSVNDVRSLGG